MKMRKFTIVGIRWPIVFVLVWDAPGVRWAVVGIGHIRVQQMEDSCMAASVQHPGGSGGGYAGLFLLLFGNVRP
jgi:hypothetical protein